MFEGFDERDVAVSDTTIHAVVGGNSGGPPLLLLHGYPQTHVLWRKVAPALAQDFSVVAPDLRGYGQSAKPPSDEQHTTYSKRAMAQDMVELMAALGHDRFCVAGHDRGARVSYRMALDHPDHVSRLALLDILPTAATWNLLQGTAGLNVYHWFFLAQRAGMPECLIGHDPGFFLRWTLDSWLGPHAPPDAIDPEAFAAYEQAFSQPDTIRATCDDYRAGATVDVDHDRPDQAAGRKIACPLLVLWGDTVASTTTTRPGRVLHRDLGAVGRRRARPRHRVRPLPARGSARSDRRFPPRVLQRRRRRMSPPNVGRRRRGSSRS